MQHLSSSQKEEQEVKTFYPSSSAGRAFRIAEVVLGSPDEYRDSWVTNLEGNFGVLFLYTIPW